MQEIDLSRLGEYVDAIDDIQNKWMLVTAEKDGKANTLTASWGGLGSLWRRKVAFIFIRPSRYTNEFIEGSGRFTLTFFDGQKDALGYLGKTSGRDVPDKAEKAGLRDRVVYNAGGMTVSEEAAERAGADVFSRSGAESVFLIKKKVLERKRGKA